jgi:hypothetical protein
MIGSSFAEALPLGHEAPATSVREAAAVAIGDENSFAGCAEAVTELEGLLESPQDDLAAANKLALQALNTLTRNDVKILARSRKPPISKTAVLHLISWQQHSICVYSKTSCHDASRPNACCPLTVARATTCCCCLCCPQWWCVCLRLCAFCSARRTPCK